MRLVIVESPYAGRGPYGISWFDRMANTVYARRCIKDCLLREEAPFASHLLYTQLGVLNDAMPNQRLLGMKAGWAWMKKADAVVVYCDRGITPGMRKGIQLARDLDIPLEQRFLYPSHKIILEEQGWWA